MSFAKFAAPFTMVPNSVNAVQGSSAVILSALSPLCSSLAEVEVTMRRSGSNPAVIRSMLVRMRLGDATLASCNKKHPQKLLSEPLGAMAS